MDIWAWIVVYAVGLTLLQLLVYRYLVNSGGSLTRRVGSPFGDTDGDSSWQERPSRSDASSDAAGLSSSSNVDVDVDADTDAGPTSRPGPHTNRSRPDVAASTAVATGRSCPHCGATNESDTTFSRCWNCTRAL